MRDAEEPSVPKRWTDREQTATYRAEELWYHDEDEPRLTDLDACRRLLVPHVHPTLLDRVTFEAIKGRPCQTGETLGQLVYTEWYQWRLRVWLPVQPATVLHEAAHLLLESCGGTDLHNAEFRRCLVWLVQRHYGIRRARMLQRAYEAQGLAQ